MSEVRAKQFDIGDKVKKISDGKIGVVKNSLNFSDGLRYEVRFENGGSTWLSADILEPFIEIKTCTEAFQNFEFGGIEDYKRTMSFQRLSGDLTNMFYSMNNSQAKYWPHQFLPVTKFLQSPEERILIADEVGLGKTIEAMYIWKELEARRNAKRLLVVCPAALREKWKRDMENLFGIHAEIVKSDRLFDTFHLIERNRNIAQFAYVTSIESIRVKWDDKGKKRESRSNVCRLNKEFEDFAANHGEPAFNLVIIDEAHYLRNRETANFKTGERLRDISEAMVLLSATPIQTDSGNLYSMMNLLSPERFDNEWAFQHLLERDGVYVRLANCLQRSSIEDFNNIAVEDLKKNATDSVLKDDLIIEIMKNENEIFASTEKRMDYMEELRNQVFYSNLFNRTRRRFVFENTAKRKPHAVGFRLSINEYCIYSRVTAMIKEMAKEQDKIVAFALIARQRQMASCLPAAFKDWQEKFEKQTALNSDDEEQDISESSDDENDEDVELSEFENDTGDETNSDKKKVIKNLKPFYTKINEEFPDVRYDDLKAHDSKYEKFLESVKELLKENPKEKIIVFSFFRGTNEYLEERLEEDGIRAIAIKGGMGTLKDDALDEFRENKEINVLISSEVGSEGLDLQFCSVEYNYDLPWNPMRLEQRIGRIDRIGQKADVLRIYNLYCQNTIDDRILERLYERIKIFENSIGDIEDIVGQPVQDLALEILDPNLTEDDINEKVEQKIQVLESQRMMNNQLEEQSGLLDVYRDLVLNSVQAAKENKRCIDTDEKIFIIRDFIKNYFHGTEFFQDKENPMYYSLRLSQEAILAFRDFRRAEHLEKFTSIDHSGSGKVTLYFEKKDDRRARQNAEMVNLDHPIFDFIKWTLRNKPIQASGCSAITMKPNDFLKAGTYVYYIQKWEKTGVEKSSELKYFVGSMNDGTMMSDNASEKIMNSAITQGASLVQPEVKLRNLDSAFARNVINHAWDSFAAFAENYKRKSASIFARQAEFVNFTADRKIASRRQAIEMLAENGNSNMIHMNEKWIERIDSERNLKLKELERNQYNEPEVTDVAIGVLVAE